MFRTLLLLTFLCTCGPAFSQVAKPVTDPKEISVSRLQLSVDAGVGYARFNDRPEIVFPTPSAAIMPNVTGEKLRATAGESIGINLDYFPAKKPLGVQIRLQYLTRGYDHVYVSKSERATTFMDNYLAEVHFLDFMPGINYRIGTNFRVSGGPYVSAALGESENPLRSERILNRSDYGAHFGARYGVGRLYARVKYQHSFRDFSLASFPDYNNGTSAPEKTSPISLINVGIGYQLVR